MYLLSADMVVAPPSLDVYNSLVVERKERLEAERAACDVPAGNEASEAQLLAVEIARREQLAREAEQHMALARKAAEERERVREEKRAKMQAEAAEARAKQPEKSKVERTPNGARIIPIQ